MIRLITYYGSVQEVYYYWFKSGDFFTESYIRQQLNIAWNHLLRRPASASLIRVSTRIQGDQIESAEARLLEFSKALLPYVKETLP